MMNVLWRHLDIPVQIRIVDQPAYLLHRRAWQNTSLILDLLTLDYGRVSILAKGSRKSKSSGIIQPFHQLNVSWSGRQALKTMVGIDGVRIPLEESLYLPLLYINELLVSFLPQHEANPRIFDAYTELLENINLLNTEKCLRIFERSTMQELGYLPEMNIEATSDAPVEADKNYLFKATEGFISCDKDAANAISGKHIIAWNEFQYSDSHVLQIAKVVMRSIIDCNLQGKRLKSRDIYSQIKNWK